MNTFDPSAADAPGSTDLHSRVARGVAWGMTASMTMQFSRIVFGLVLARLLTPHEYGLAAMALVFTGVVLAFSDLSLSAGLVRRPHITEADRSTVFWTSMVVGLLLSTLGVAASGPIADFYGEPRVQPLLAVLSIGFFITAFQPTQHALLQRDMNFRAISIRLMTGTVLSGIAGVVAAALGAGAWALIVQQLVLATVSSVLIWGLSSWRPKLLFSFQSLRELGPFGLKLLGTRLLSYAKGNSDNILVGRFLGAASLGIHSLAYNLMMLPIYRLIVPLLDALYPALSRMQDDRSRMGRVWLRASQFVAAFILPGMLALVVVAPDLVHVLLGSRWEAVTPVLQLLAIVAMAYSISIVGTSVLTALDRTRTLLQFGVGDFLVAVTAVAIGLQWGIVGVAVAYAASSVPVQTVMVGLTARTLGVTARQTLGNLVGVAAAAALMAGGAWALREVLVAVGVPTPLRLIATLGGCLALYLPLCWWWAPDVLAEIRQALEGRRSSATAAGIETAETPTSPGPSAT